MAQYLGTVKLGGFYNNGAALARPTKPWRNDTEPYSGAGRGNIPSISGDISNYSFGNTPSDDAKKLQWVKIKDGDKIAIPADLTNGGRALKLLEAAGLFTLNPDKGYVPNKTDITHFNKKVQIVEAESGMLANLLPDVTAAVINGGNAFTAKLDPYADSIFSENLDPKTNPYFGQLVNVIVAREADKDNPVYKKVVAAYQTQDVAQTLKDAYKGAYVPVWPGAADYKLK